MSYCPWQLGINPLLENAEIGCPLQSPIKRLVSNEFRQHRGTRSFAISTTIQQYFRPWRILYMGFLKMVNPFWLVFKGNQKETSLGDRYFEKHPYIYIYVCIIHTYICTYYIYIYTYHVLALNRPFELCAFREVDRAELLQRQLRGDLHADLEDPPKSCHVGSPNASNKLFSGSAHRNIALVPS